MSAPAWAKGRDESEVRLDVEEYVQAVADTEDGRKWLRALSRKIESRAREIGRVLMEAKAAHYWKEEASTWTVGLLVFCNAQGFFLGGTVQRGTERKVVAVQKRARRVWLAPVGKTADRKTWTRHSAANLLRYDFRRTTPENPMPEAERKRLEQTGGDLTEALS